VTEPLQEQSEDRPLRPLALDGDEEYQMEQDVEHSTPVEKEVRPTEQFIFDLKKEEEDLDSDGESRKQHDDILEWKNNYARLQRGTGNGIRRVTMDDSDSSSDETKRDSIVGEGHGDSEDDDDGYYMRMKPERNGPQAPPVTSVKDWVPASGDTFASFGNAKIFIKEWAYRNGWKTTIRDSSLDPAKGTPYGKNMPARLFHYFEIVFYCALLTARILSSIAKMTCTFEGKPKSKKNPDVSRQNNRAPSKCCNCPVYVGLSSPKELRETGAFKITTFHLNHEGHELDTTLDQYTTLTQDMLAAIRKCAAMKASSTQTMDHLNNEFNMNEKLIFNMTQVKRHLEAFKHMIKFPNKVPQSAQLVSILLAHHTNGWYSSTRYDKDYCLISAFWMSPSQLQLYRQYHDVIVNDSTMQTNRLGMKLNCTVVVDANFKTRLVACALSAHETETDYHWILEQLKKATGYLEPKVIMVDEDTAMDAALPEVFPRTHIVNCIWHIHENIRRHLSSPLGRRFDAFMARFRQVTDSLTPAVFDRHWLKLLEDFNNQKSDKPDDEKLYVGSVGKHLKRLYERRHHWAGPWVQASFTAGMRSTQRVEKSHHLIKKMGVDSKTKLAALFDVISGRVDQELFKSELSSKKEVTQKNPLIQAMFRSVIESNEKYLGSYAKIEMQEEISNSVGMKHKSVRLDQVLNGLGGARWEDASTAVSNGAICAAVSLTYPCST